MSERDVKLVCEESLFRTNAFHANLDKTFRDLEPCECAAQPGNVRDRMHHFPGIIDAKTCFAVSMMFPPIICRLLLLNCWARRKFRP